MEWRPFIFIMVMLPTTVLSRNFRRRHHSDPFHDMESVPDLEAMLPVGYLAKHKNDFHRLHVSTGNKDIRNIINPYQNNKEPATQYVEMGSMKNLRKSHLNELLQKNKSPYASNNDRSDDKISLRGITFRKSNDQGVVKKYSRRRHNSRKSFEDKLARALFQQTHPHKSAASNYFQHIPPFRKSNEDVVRYHIQKQILPELTKEQLDHPGNSLFFMKDKRILGAHHFPKKEPTHSVYGNFETLGLNVRPTSEEMKLKAIKKILQETPPDAQEKPWRLYNPNHPGLNLLFEKKMPLEAAKFSKPKTFLVYGNLDNLEERYKDSDRYLTSSIRRFFKRPHSGQINLRQNNDRIHTDWSDMIKSSLIKHKLRKKEGHPHGRILFPLHNKKKSEYGRFGFPLRQTKNNEWVKKDKNEEHEEITHQKEDKKSKQKEIAERLVYGNLNNDSLGIRYGNTPYRFKYTGFRKNYPKRRPRYYYDKKERYNEQEGEESSDMDVVHKNANNNPGLILVVQKDDNNQQKLYIISPVRRSTNQRYKYTSYEKKDKMEENAGKCNQSSSSSSSSSESAEDKNPGNPYTLFKGYYKQNWLWNHQMDGDHMNINPYGPKFDSLGPTGNELFSGRKWWYFNQDDFIPFRRR
ncbi:hypothetical protein O0L34_g8286 [Tuta absoluta]|nr:hypothetical protein O0L34_g8286 [Tuta absoluta]